MKTSKTENNAIADSISSYFKSRPEVVAVYLFGSYAQGREKPFSDIDLGVLLEHKAIPQINELTMTYTVALGRILRKDFHILIMNTAGEMILSQIFKRGKCIFQRDPRLLSHFKTVSFSKIADFGYFRKSMERAFLSRIIGVSK
jgi:predicted nucleotidyltransferase